MFHPKGPTLVELATQALSSTERGYDLLAPKFDYTPFRTPDRMLETAAANTGGPGSVGSVLDVCCRTGAAMRAFAPLCRERIVGIDVSRGMLDIARARAVEMPGDVHAEFVRGNVLDMPFEAEFDLAVTFGSFGHILTEHQPRLIRQIRRALKPGGRFVFAASYTPRVTSLRCWIYRTFNAVMHIRNLLHSPPFIMYYLNFPLCRARAILEREGFAVDVREEIFEEPFTRLPLVLATAADACFRGSTMRSDNEERIESSD